MMTWAPPGRQQLIPQHWETKGELLENVRDRPLIALGWDAGYVEKWSTVELEGTVVALGLTRATQLPEMACLSHTAPLVIGFNDGLFGIDLAHRSQAFEYHFGSAFYQFIDVGEDGLVALFETGLAALGADGAERWRRDTDLIADWTPSDDHLLIKLFDGPVCAIDLTTGVVTPR